MAVIAQYPGEFDEELLRSRATENEKPSSIITSTSVPIFLRPTSLILLLLALLICNISLYNQNRRLKLAVNDDGFTGINAYGKTWKQFRTYSKYSDINQSISDAAWESFTTNGFVAIPHDEAAAFGLPVAEDFPDDSSKGVYVLGGFHEIHCVIYLRDTIKDLVAGKSVDDRAVHINNCYWCPCQLWMGTAEKDSSDPER